MKITDATKKQAVFIVFFCVILIWTGWFLWQDAGRNEGEDKSGDNNNSYETLEQNQKAVGGKPPQFGLVTDVIDSLTIVVDKSYKIRYLGVSSPATSDKVECMGKAALQANESMIGKKVKLEDDAVLSQARDGAWVRYVWVADDEITDEAYAKALNGETVLGLTEPIIEDIPMESPSNVPGEDVAEQSSLEPSAADYSNTGSEQGTESGRNSPTEIKEIAGDLGEFNGALSPELGNGENDDEVAQDAAGKPNFKEYMVSERIIEMGLGFPLLAKDMKYYDKLAAAARYSSATKRGLWGKCEISQDDKELLQVQTIEECIIKGVIVLNGDKIYRTPSCAGYKDTVVLGYKGGKWLCSEEEAVASGFVKAIDCK